MNFVLTVLSAIVLLVSTASTQPRTVVAELTFAFDTFQPIVPIRINGSRPVPFIVDTGASINVIGSTVAAETGVVPAGPTQTITGGGQQSVSTQYAEGVTLASDALAWTAQRAAVLPIGAKHFAGFIGAPILMQYVVQFDFQRRVVRLLDPQGFQPPAGAVSVPFELQADLPVVRAQVDAGSGPVEARLMVDTGAGSAFVDLNRPFVDQHRLLEVLQSANSSDRPAGIGGSAPFVYGAGKRLTLGSLVFEAPRLGLSRATQGSSSRSERDGIIGNQLLRGFVTTFDYRRRLLYLEPG